MDITLYIFFSLIGFLFMFYGWEREGLSFVLLLISFLIFTISAFNSSEITWSYAMPGNYTATVTQRSLDFSRLFGLLAGINFLMFLGKIAILAQEQLDIDLQSKISTMLRKLGINNR